MTADFAGLIPGVEGILIYADLLEESGELHRAHHLRRRYGRRSGLCLAGFVAIDRYGCGVGYGYGYDNGYGRGYDNGRDNGRDNGCGDGRSNGCGVGYGYGLSCSYGDGRGYVRGRGVGFHPIAREKR